MPSPVSDTDKRHVIACPDFVISMNRHVQIPVHGRYGDLASLRHSFHGIDKKIHECFGNMERGAFDIQQVLRQLDLYADLGIGSTQVFKFQRLLKIGDDGIKIDNAFRMNASSGQRQEVLDNCRRPGRRPSSFFRHDSAKGCRQGY